MVTDPAATPVTTPDASTVAVPVLLDDQEPPVDVSPRERVAPVQTAVPPEIAFGAALIVTDEYTSVPQPVLYVTVAVPTVLPPVSTPEVLIVDPVAASTDHVPPGVASVRVVESPPQSELAPDIGAGDPLSTFTV
jgi:hypothetical protein